MRHYIIKVEIWSHSPVYIDAPDPEEGLRIALRCYGSEVRRLTFVPTDLNKDAQNDLLERKEPK